MHSATVLQKLQKCQNREARIVQALEWPTVMQLIEPKTARALDYLNRLFHRLSDSHSKTLRNFKIDPRTPMLKASYGQKSF